MYTVVCNHLSPSAIKSLEVSHTRPTLCPCQWPTQQGRILFSGRQTFPLRQLCIGFVCLFTKHNQAMVTCHLRYILYCVVAWMSVHHTNTYYIYIGYRNEVVRKWLCMLEMASVNEFEYCLKSRSNKFNFFINSLFHPSIYSRVALLEKDIFFSLSSPRTCNNRSIFIANNFKTRSVLISKTTVCRSRISCQPVQHQFCIFLIMCTNTWQMICNLFLCSRATLTWNLRKLS